MAATLLSPAQIGGLSLANRVVMAPLTRGRAGISRVPNDVMVKYYEQRASAGLIITEATPVSDQGYGWYATPGIYTEEQARGWKKIVDAVHAKGGKIVLQMWHMGRQSHSSFHLNREIVAPSAIKVPGEGHVRDANRNAVPFETPRAIREEEIPALVQSFKEAAKHCKFAGFDGVEIHSANGYLIDTFLQSSTNHRNDRYGGSFENRVRLLTEVIEAIGQVYPMDRIGVRVSPNGSFGGMGSEDNDKMFPFVASVLKHYGLAYLHVMDGLGFGFHEKCSIVTLFEMKSKFQGPVIGNIGYTKDTAEGAIRTGAVDLISFGRPYITNPDLVERFKNNWPLAADAPMSDWSGTTPKGDDSAEGYITYEPYKP